MRDRLDEFGDAVVVVAFEPPERLAAYRAHLDVPFSLLADIDRVLYRLLGAGRATNRQVWSLGTIRQYARLMRHGWRLRRPTADIHQRGADAVVGRDGVLRYLALPASPDRRPPIDDLIDALNLT